MPFDASAATLADLFATYRAILRELKKRGIVRTSNAPAGDYAEYLVVQALGGELARNSKRSYDVQIPDGRRIQVKCRIAGEGSRTPRSQLSPFRSFDFDAAAIVLLNPDYTVARGVLAPCYHVQACATFRPHVNGYVVYAKKPLLDHGSNTDITDALRLVTNEGRRIEEGHGL